MAKDEKQRRTDQTTAVVVPTIGSGGVAAPSTTAASQGVHISSNTVKLGDTDLTYAIGDWLEVDAGSLWANRHRTRNAQTGTSYTVLNSDRAKFVTFSNASAIAVTLPQASSVEGTITAFKEGWWSEFVNIGAGTVTVTPSTSTIDGAASLTLAQYQGVLVFSDGTNYFTQRGRANTNITTVQNGLTLAAGVLKWGGALTEHTTISGTNKDLTISISDGTRTYQYLIDTSVNQEMKLKRLVNATNYSHVAFGASVEIRAKSDDGETYMTVTDETVVININAANLELTSATEKQILTSILTATYTGSGVTPTEFVGRDAVTGKFAPIAGTSVGLTHPQVLARTLGA